jgi:hypothetical protein
MEVEAAYPKQISTRMSAMAEMKNKITRVLMAPPVFQDWPVIKQISRRNGYHSQAASDLQYFMNNDREVNEAGCSTNATERAILNVA